MLDDRISESTSTNSPVPVNVSHHALRDKSRGYDVISRSSNGRRRARVRVWRRPIVNQIGRAYPHWLKDKAATGTPRHHVIDHVTGSDYDIKVDGSQKSSRNKHKWNRPTNKFDINHRLCHGNRPLKFAFRIIRFR